MPRRLLDRRTSVRAGCADAERTDTYQIMPTPERSCFVHKTACDMLSISRMPIRQVVRTD
jgi:hypothetical protein